MNYKVLSFSLSLIVIALFASLIFNQFFLRSSFYYQNYESLRTAENESWLPAYIPNSAFNIEEKQNHDSGELRATFEYEVNDISHVEKACIKVFERVDLTKYVCPTFESRTNTIILGTNGQARFISHATNL